VAGRIERVDARWDGPLPSPSDWRLQAQATGLRVEALARPPDARGHARPGIPGVEGAALQLDAGPAGGHASVSMAGGALSFPGVFEEPRIPLDELKMQAQWRLQGDRIDVQVDELPWPTLMPPGAGALAQRRERRRQRRALAGRARPAGALQPGQRRARVPLPAARHSGPRAPLRARRRAQG
jgi:hypothetical protein